jgi:hypothetical protein
MSASAEMGPTTEAESMSATGQRRAGAWLLVFGLFCLEAAIYLTFAAGRLDVAEAVYLHLGLCTISAVFGCGWVLVSRSVAQAHHKAAFVLALVICTSLGGPFGTLLAATLLLPRRSESTLAAQAMTGSELTRLEILHGALLDRRLRVEGTQSARPLLDVMIDGTAGEKFDALSLISKRYVRALAPALKRALEDKDGSVRVLAAKVMAQQHDAYTNRIGALQANAAATPENSAYWNELARAHLDYAESGLLDASRADAEVRHAETYFARMAQLTPPTR